MKKSDVSAGKSVWERLAAMTPEQRATFFAEPRMPQLKADMLSTLYSAPRQSRGDAREAARMREIVSRWRRGDPMHGA